jgi:hypothetical protein
MKACWPGVMLTGLRLTGLEIWKRPSVRAMLMYALRTVLACHHPLNSGDPSWAEGGSLFTVYDLHLDDDDYSINREYSLSVSVLDTNADIWVGDAVSVPDSMGVLLN